MIRRNRSNDEFMIKNDSSLFSSNDSSIKSTIPKNEFALWISPNNPDIPGRLAEFRLRSCRLLQHHFRSSIPEPIPDAAPTTSAVHHAFSPPLSTFRSPASSVHSSALPIPEPIPDAAATTLVFHHCFYPLLCIFGSTPYFVPSSALPIRGNHFYAPQ